MGGPRWDVRCSRRDVLWMLAASAVVLRRGWAQAAEPGLGDVLARCACCVVGRSLAAEADWWWLGGKRRIVTVHRFAVEQVVDGEVAVGEELLVRTLGGQVGDFAQRVIGEAEIGHDAPSLLMLAAAEPGMHAVAGMAHGCFGVAREPDGVVRLRARGRSPSHGPTAVLEGATVAEARALIVRARHAR